MWNEKEIYRKTREMLGTTVKICFAGNIGGEAAWAFPGKMLVYKLKLQLLVNTLISQD